MGKLMFFLPSVYCAIAHFQTNHDKPNESGVNHWISWDLGPQRLRGCGIMLTHLKKKRYIAINPTGIR